MRASRMTAARLPCDWASARLACGAAGNQPRLVVTGLESALRSRSSLGVDWGAIRGSYGSFNPGGPARRRRSGPLSGLVGSWMGVARGRRPER
jgi:hypothetical protein